MPDLTGAAEKTRRRKIALRSHLLTARRQMSPSALAAAAAQLQDQVLEAVRVQRATTIAAYVPVGAEPGGPGLVASLAAHGRVLLPVLRPDNDLDWAPYEGTTVPGPRGLLEPPGPRLGVDAILSADLVLVPALAVDRHGFRMGRGGGSYDRVLSRLAVLPPPSAPPSSAPPPSTPPPSTPPSSTPPPSTPPPSTPPSSTPPPSAPPPSAPPPSSPSSADHTSPASAPLGARTPLVLALLHDGELLDEVPAEPHDRPVHGALTPHGGLFLAPT
ncbi:5-formyltetrahydrofolate cyclo-ligase [Actinoplanes sp. NPDC049596]|uniref:5-formyltetrahydrofolate cyclo-ligase n=1 Tax=unclassified Actinoplanes TaxID=2626549 RepID=UPI00342C25A5